MFGQEVQTWVFLLFSRRKVQTWVPVIIILHVPYSCFFLWKTRARTPADSKFVHGLLKEDHATKLPSSPRTPTILIPLIIAHNIPDHTTSYPNVRQYQYIAEGNYLYVYSLYNSNDSRKPRACPLLRHDSGRSVHSTTGEVFDCFNAIEINRALFCVYHFVEFAWVKQT